MPHFWIICDTGKQQSVLDLPRRMMDDDGLPHTILIFTGATDQQFQKKAEMQTTMATPTTTVFIGTPSAPSSAVRFDFYGHKPRFPTKPKRKQKINTPFK